MDKRRTVSHNKIIKALSQFAEEGHPFIEVTVADFAKKAAVSRPTIYRNYLTLKDPLLVQLQFKMNDFTNSLERQPIDSSTFIRLTLTYWQQNIKLLNLLIWADSIDELNHTFSSWIGKLLANRHLSKRDQKYIANFYAATVVSFIRTFIANHDFSDSAVTETVTLFNQLTNNCGQLFFHS
ncbi:TetR/AcrR family transcriptional regulator [Pediococcus ethanolidurans]|uniref:TetR/AcrR family transcriptional regulator n=1 Tax=Pediococcus ethanolidurans TaxID=319653 RepID=UPI001C1E9677|nr:TetR/AcrR family transcriptional regulator [Pediococcus ethanolidurans]MBU7563601.1 TetR/AcrR family transcriptional regulator [Pediococcus ethanolidurans]MCV3315037.1 TetR/AcrR family transcriptional regulator [Pediococcus ethanolidurans]MCV3322175.1 TetR/AcrR family transcriptional regulator [Pediococcus ethanolidurans]MCV3323493.1 TetR/AcrR family transcriptional regulator [Pediococcus ethanolidurans]MCV3328231.1 TetR/AcrR family transcriptional regulator [Pediococcus ethanolidurans]